jgi:hypothetical protein
MRACAQDGEDPDGRCHFHLGPGQGVGPPVRQREAQARAARAKSSSTPPPLTTDEVDRMYYQLAEIPAIAVVQLRSVLTGIKMT